MALTASEVTDNDFRTVEYVLKNRKAKYEEICSALKKATDKEEIKSRRSSVGAIDKPTGPPTGPGGRLPGLFVTHAQWVGGRPFRFSARAGRVGVGFSTGRPWASPGF